jgi:hypothetical protein
MSRLRFYHHHNLAHLDPNQEESNPRMMAIQLAGPLLDRLLEHQANNQKLTD